MFEPKVKGYIRSRRITPIPTRGVKAEVKKYHLVVLASADEADEYEYPRLLLALRMLKQCCKPWIKTVRLCAVV